MTLPTPDDRLLARLRDGLVAWFREHQRDLPWRHQPINAYRVLVSEAMLQQTQVATVLPYFERFIARWPTVADLAAATEQDVLAQWQGLGYYRRARHLHAAAKAIVEQHAGKVPRTAAELLALPGVGRYTAGAIASIAFDQPSPILDGNVMRVFARWFNIRESIDDKAVQNHLWQLASRIVSPPPPPPGGLRDDTGDDPRDDDAPRAKVPGGELPGEERPGEELPGGAGDINQGLMELGALVCVPKSPSCLLCPVQRWCGAHAAGTQADLPVRTPKKKPTAVTHHAVVVQRRGQLLIEQRPTEGLWSNMWQVPTAEALGASADADAAAHAVRDWLKSHVGVDARVALDHQFTHQTTHRTITFCVWTAHGITGRLKRGFGGQWRKADALDDLPLANPQRRIVKTLG